MSQFRAFRIALQRQLTRRRRLHESRWRELCRRRRHERGDARAPALSRTSGGGLRTIHEVADEIGVASHVLRFWESRFPELRAVKQSGGRRYYRPEDVELVRSIRHLLCEHGYTIKGVQRILRERGVDRQRRAEG